MFKKTVLGSLALGLLSLIFSQQVSAQTVDYQCIGKGLAEYMNEIVDAKGSFRHIRLLSPAFNMTSPHFQGITSAMAENGARFGELDGIAGNAYNFGGKRISEWVSSAMSSSPFNGMPLMLTETGKIDLGLIELREELLKIQRGSYGSGQYIGGLLFNAFNTNSSWSNFRLSDSEIQQICSGSCQNVGVNSASFYSQPSSFYSHAQGLGMKHTIEIARNDVGGALAGIRDAHAKGIIPVIRIGVGSDSGGFSEASDYVSFLKAIDAAVSAPVYAIAGPNEPESEPWATPECAIAGPLISPRCAEISDSDFHTLRPAPHSPCDLGISQTTLMCGNQLVVKERLKVTPSQSNLGCRTNSDGAQVCSYELKSQVKIHVDLDEADLPIVGNTELVPNSQSPTNTLDPLTRLNEYVSWYLNGALTPAEEEFRTSFDPNELGPEYINYLVNLSGPLRKLLPWRVQADARVKQVDEGDASRRGAGIRHDQIVGCVISSIAGGVFPAKCYNDGSPERKRLTDWLPHKPPKEEDPNANTLAKFSKAYQEWRGKGCITILGFNVCSNIFVNRFWSMLFMFIPPSSTEDRKGFATTRNPGETTTGTPGVDVVKITDIIYERDPQGINEIFYFPHMQETTELANLLQGTYAPAGQSREANTKNESVAPEIRPGCVILETRSNPGDSLWAEHNEIVDGVSEEPISSQVTYTATFDCTFSQGGQIDQTCVENNFENGLCSTIEECQNQCTKQICEKDTTVAVPIDTNIPKAEELWNRLVEGDLAVFKRFFPKFGANSPILQPKDLPTVTQASYSSEKLGGPDSSITTEAGPVGSSKSGDSAEIYFPHIGALKEYFLNGIQNALRPKGYGQITLAGAPDPRTPEEISEVINCNQSIPDSQIPSRYLGDFKANIIDLANRWVSGSGRNYAKECYNDVVSRSLKAGINPAFTLLIWLNESGASNYTSYVTSQETQDFGINIPSIASNFDAQLNQFLVLPNSSTYRNCYAQGGWDSFTHAFLVVFQSGQCNRNHPTGSAYYEGIRSRWPWVAGSCSFLNDPKDLSCP